jgi:hypothetical protein
VKLLRAPDDENFPAAHLVSAPAGRWELGLVPMLFGVRVRVGLVGDLGPELDYCAGAERTMQMLLLGLITGYMACLPEEVTRYDLRALFPVQHKRPMDQDKECMGKLLELATVISRMYPDERAQPIS